MFHGRGSQAPKGRKRGYRSHGGVSGITSDVLLAARKSLAPTHARIPESAGFVGTPKSAKHLIDWVKPGAHETYATPGTAKPKHTGKFLHSIKHSLRRLGHRIKTSLKSLRRKKGNDRDRMASVRRAVDKAYEDEAKYVTKDLTAESSPEEWERANGYLRSKKTGRVRPSVKDTKYNRVGALRIGAW